MYNRGWQIPDGHINWTYYIFYGADIRIQQLDYIRDQIITLAHNIYEMDGEFTDYMEGVFDLKDDEDTIFFTWKIEDGEFTEIKERR